jgi:hypothetical protein
MTKKLTNLVIDRVDLVDQGANPEAHVTLAKRAPEPADPPAPSRARASTRATRTPAPAPSTPTDWPSYVAKYPDAATRVDADPVHVVDIVWGQIEEAAARRGGFAKAATVPDLDRARLVDEFIQTDEGRVLYRRYVESMHAVTKRSAQTVVTALEAAGIEPKPYDPATDRIPLR